MNIPNWVRTAQAKILNRAMVANILIFCFILLGGIGAFLINVPAGFISLGVACGVVGFLLGME